MKLKKEHHDNIVLISAVMSIALASVLLWDHHKNSKTSSATSAGANPLTAMSTGIPVFEISSVGGSQAVSGIIGANPIGNSRRGEQPLGGFMDYTGPHDQRPLEGPGSGTVQQQYINQPANVANEVVG